MCYLCSSSTSDSGSVQMMNRELIDARIFSVRVDTKALCGYFEKYMNKEDNKYAQLLYREVAATFEKFAESMLEDDLDMILNEAMMEWDI